MPTLARQAGESLAHRGIQAFDKGGIEHGSSTRSRKQGLRLLQRPLHHLARDFYHAFLFRPFDHHRDTQLRPHPQASTSASGYLFDASFETPAEYCPGYAFQPSVHTNSAHMGWQQARTCWSKRFARLRSRLRLTTPPNHKRVDTIIAKPIQAIILCPFTRISSACTCTKSSCPCWTNLWWTRLPVLPRSVSPAGHRAFVQAKRLHNRLDRTAIRQERHDNDNHCLRFA